METFNTSSSRPVVLQASVEGQVYALFALALTLTLAGVYAGILGAVTLLTSGVNILFLIAELAIIFTSRLWMNRSPLNVILFGVFPFLSGLTLTPYILTVLSGYVNGPSILLNAAASTVLMTGAAAVFARTTRWDLSGISRFLVLGLFGVIAFALLQIFIPGLRGGGAELLLSGGSIVLFAAFTAYDIQRIQTLSRSGMNPFLLALSLYLDIFNLFISVLRFILALSGNRR